ncbi:MAG TPA: hypothetical protein VHE35_08975 [Kofleriaceae bacterium]|nr:hypothetical protein [Kofleriaceae bacterium]
MKTPMKSIVLVLGAVIGTSSTAFADAHHATAPTRIADLKLRQDEHVTVVNPPAPAGTSDETYQEFNGPVFVSGAVLFGASWGAGAIAASQSDRKGDDRLYVPLVGPWLDLADRGDCPVAERSCDNETTEKVLIIGDGVLQAAGAVLMLDGALVPRTVHRTTPAYARISPIHVGTDGHGFAWNGTF